MPPGTSYHQDLIDIDVDTGVMTWEEAPDYENPPTRRIGYYSWSYTTIIKVSNGSLVDCIWNSGITRQVEIGLSDVMD